MIEYQLVLRAVESDTNRAHDMTVLYTTTDLFTATSAARIVPQALQKADKRRKHPQFFPMTVAEPGVPVGQVNPPLGEPTEVALPTSGKVRAVRVRPA